ncbi:hypothetical protein V1477_011461 [Vespula maculifrons]|uniref:Uncharacterized protein n=1 Tax=Vespula maculifrons TaxID=7453 RepID=A0ABD2BZ94_VESMC
MTLKFPLHKRLRLFPVEIFLTDKAFGCTYLTLVLYFNADNEVSEPEFNNANIDGSQFLFKKEELIRHPISKCYYNYITPRPYLKKRFFLFFDNIIYRNII